MSDFQDKTLSCQDCGAEFTFSGDEQQFFADKGFSEPKRCGTCRQKKKQESRGTRTLTKVTCSGCGGEAEVPFVPQGDRPVYCNDCFQKQKEQG